MADVSSQVGRDKGAVPAPQGPALRAGVGALRGRGQRLLFGAAGFGLAVAVWYLIWLSGIVNRGLLPRPDEVLRTLIEGLRTEGLLYDVRVSVFRVTVAVLAGTVLAIPIGFVLAWYRSLRAMFDPLVSFFRALPPISLIPLVIVYLGIGELARVTILFYAAFFAAVVVLYEGIAAIDDIYIRAARALGADDREVFRKVVIPLVVPQFFVALRVALGVAWATLVAAELIAAQRGLGAVIQNAANFLHIPTIYMGIILIGASALLMDQILRAFMAYFVRWQERVER